MGRRVESQAERQGEETGSTDQVLLAYAGLFVRPQRPAVMLEGLLREASGWPVRVEPFAGRWLALRPRIARASAAGATPTPSGAA